MQQIADLLVEARARDARERAPVRSVVGVHEHDWATELPGALHLVDPQGRAASPDLGLGYSPN